jgi:hypothetical protein
VAKVILLAALFLPGHLGLMDLLKELGNLVPAANVYDVNSN